MTDLLDAILNLSPETAKKVLNQLEPLEREVLNILLKKEVALTTQQIIDALVEDLAEEIISKFENIYKEYLKDLEEVHEKEKKELERLKPDPLFGRYNSSFNNILFKNKYKNKSITLFEKRFYPAKVTIPYDELYIAVKDYYKKYQELKEKGKITKSDLIKLKKELVGRFCEIPSFRRIEETILPELIASGLVIERNPISKKRAKKLYSANPALYSILE